jgi:hypothetical protein
MISKLYAINLPFVSIWTHRNTDIKKIKIKLTKEQKQSNLEFLQSLKKVYKVKERKLKTKDTKDTKDTKATKKINILFTEEPTHSTLDFTFI